MHIRFVLMFIIKILLKICQIKLMKVSNASKLGAFFKLLGRWHGSMYKLIYTE